MWGLQVVNNYNHTLTVADQSVNPGQTLNVPGALSSTFLTVPGLGFVNFVDLGEHQISGYSKATWGVLISYQGHEMEYRYEGGGQLQVTINQFGQANVVPLNGGSVIMVVLPPFS